MLLTTDVSKILKTFQRDLTFIFDLLSKSLFGFAFVLGFLGCRKCCYVYKKTFLQRTSQRNNAQLCRNVLAQSWLQYGIKFLTKYLSCRKQKCVTPLQSAITQKCEVSQPHVLIFFVISSSFSISSTISRGKIFRGDPKKSLFR